MLTWQVGKPRSWTRLMAASGSGAIPVITPSRIFFGVWAASGRAAAIWSSCRRFTEPILLPDEEHFGVWSGSSVRRAALLLAGSFGGQLVAAVVVGVAGVAL